MMFSVRKFHHGEYVTLAIVDTYKTAQLIRDEYADEFGGEVDIEAALVLTDVDYILNKLEIN